MVTFVRVEDVLKTFNLTLPQISLKSCKFRGMETFVLPLV